MGVFENVCKYYALYMYNVMYLRIEYNYYTLGTIIDLSFNKYVQYP